jgi:hypothetical protein
MLGGGIFEHEGGLALVQYLYKSNIQIIHVREDDYVVSLIHLECASHGCMVYVNNPIITNNNEQIMIICKYL